MVRIIAAVDHPVELKGIRETVRETFGDVIMDEVRKGYDLLGTILHKEYDIVILDIVLPDIDGLDAVKEIKKKRARLPVLVIGAHPEEHYAIRVIKAGGSGYVSKRTTCEELTLAIRKVLSGKRYVDPALAEQMLLDFESNAEKLAHAKLSDREFQVACMLGKGKTVKEIMQELHLSVNTVRTYRARALSKMGVKATTELIHYAIKNSLVE
jgi:two-component system invasion response regulator UvrY